MFVNVYRWKKLVMLNFAHAESAIVKFLHRKYFCFSSYKLCPESYDYIVSVKAAWSYTNAVTTIIMLCMNLEVSLWTIDIITMSFHFNWNRIDIEFIKASISNFINL